MDRSIDGRLLVIKRSIGLNIYDWCLGSGTEVIGSLNGVLKVVFIGF